jgi:hypothetical protein
MTLEKLGRTDVDFSTIIDVPALWGPARLFGSIGLMADHSLSVSS